MAFVNKGSANKKNERQLKKDKQVVQLKQEDEEDNDNEDMDDSDEEKNDSDCDHDSESDKAEDKELNSDLEEDDEGDSDEDDESEKLPNLPKKDKQIKIEKEHTKESRGESDARSLYVGKLPDGVTEQDLKDLSKDIVEVYVPKNNTGNFRFAFIRFNDEATAEANHSILQTKKIQDQLLTVDYVGSKSTFNGNNRKEERNARKLFVGNLPDDITEEELQSLSEDIVEIYIAQGRKFAFLTFDSQAKAESNYEILKDQKIRGQQIFVDVCSKKGEDSNNVKQLSVSGLPLDVTIEQVATYFKKAFQITLNRSNTFRTATISFDTEEDAKEAIDAAKDATISEHKLISVLCENSDRRPERGGQYRGGGGGRNNWGKRSHNGNFRGGQGNFRGGQGNFRGGQGNFRGGQRFAKRMRS